MVDKVERPVSEYAWLCIKRAHVQRPLFGTSGRPKCCRRSVFPPATCPRAAPAAFWIPVVIWRSEVLIASVTAGLP
jgi:hypothetical protein